MSKAWSWLAPKIHDAPAQLRERMRGAVMASAGQAVHEQLLGGATICLRAALQHPSEKGSALDLLSADALLTHACAAAAEAGSDELTRFTAHIDAQYFQGILDERSDDH